MKQIWIIKSIHKNGKYESKVNIFAVSSEEEAKKAIKRLDETKDEMKVFEDSEIEYTFEVINFYE